MALLKEYDPELAEYQEDILAEIFSLVKPWIAVRLAFAPRYESTTPWTELAVKARAWLGFAITAWLCWPYLGFGFVDDFFQDIGRSVLIAGIVALTVLAVAFFLYERADRSRYLVRAAWPAGRVVGALLLVLVLSHIHGPSGFGGLLLAVTVGLWVAVFGLCAMWQIGWSLFGTSDAHPLLGPVTGALTLTVALIYKLAFAENHLPESTLLTIAVTGYLTAVSLCLLEIFQIFRMNRAHS